jgi:hypothetical protein
MTADPLDDQLRRLTADVERAGEALVELELDPTRELLDGARLTGTTAARWGEASAAVRAAWELREELEGRLERLEELRRERGRGRTELAEALGAVPADPVARIVDAVDQARDVLNAVAAAWDPLVPRLTTASATLRACGELLEGHGIAPGPRLAGARAELARVTDATARDPLGASPAAVDDAEASVAAVRAEAERLRDLCARADARLEEAAALLDAARRADADARAAHALARAKIAGAELPAPPAPPPGLDARLERAAGLVRAGAWREADEALEAWTAEARRARDEAQVVAAANRAPIALRDELRGRLDAYRAKSRGLRRLEDPALTSLHERAHRALHTAPTDLAGAEALVRRYQESLSGREVIR